MALVVYIFMACIKIFRAKILIHLVAALPGALLENISC